MPKTVDPYAGLRVMARERASSTASTGRTDVGVRIETELAAEIDKAAVAAVPPYGRVYLRSLAAGLSWGAAILILLAMFGPVGGGTVPALRIFIGVLVIVWAAAFGAYAAHHKVRVRRARFADMARAVVRRTASDTVDQLGADARWWVDLRVRPGQLAGYVVDGSLQAVHRAVAEPGPMVLFVREPGVFSEAARTAGQRFGVALFALTASGPVAMDPVASAALAAADPITVLRTAWSGGARFRPGPSA